MKAVLVAIVLFLAALGGLYGYEYQGELIEAKVTERVTERLGTLDAAGVRPHVDRRKVMLSGIVTSQVERAEILGAIQILPSVDRVIDGLSVLPNASHFVAIKMKDGLILSGTVADQNMHDRLLAQASTMAKGAFFESLEINNRPVGWLEDARLGLEKLKELKTGVLSLNDAGFAISGVVSGDPKGFAEALPFERGWRVSVGTDQDITALEADRAAIKSTLTRVQSELAELREKRLGGQENMIEQALEPEARVKKLVDRINELEQELEARNDAIVSLRGQIGDRDTALYGAQSEVDAAKAELALLRKSDEGTGLAGVQCAAMSEALLSTGQISFETGTAELDASSLALLERLTGLAMICVGPSLSLEIGGHTDSQGSEEYNLDLSEERAKSVRIFLIGRGVSEDGVTAIGYGEAQPIADNETAEGRSANRRITFQWSRK